MSMETRVQVRRYVDGDEVAYPPDMFLRRDYTVYQEYQAMPLTSGTKTDIDTILTDIEYVYVRRTGDAATLSLFKNLSPESWEFNDGFLLIEGENIDSLAIQSDASTTVYIYIAGS